MQRATGHILETEMDRVMANLLCGGDVGLESGLKARTGSLGLGWRTSIPIDVKYISHCESQREQMT